MPDLSIDEARKRAEEALGILAAGSDPLADSGYGYEHMGDMARDLEPLARFVLALAARVEELQEQGLTGATTNATAQAERAARAEAERDAAMRERDKALEIVLEVAEGGDLASNGSRMIRASLRDEARSVLAGVLLQQGVKQ